MTNRNSTNWLRTTDHIRKILGTCLLFVVMVSGVFAQPDFSDVEVKSYHVQGNIWALTGAGGNVTVQIGDQGVLVVDTQFAGMAPKLLAEIRRLAPGKTIRYVLNTHGHGDHVGGNQAIREAGSTIVAGNEGRDTSDNGAEVIAHENAMLSMATADPSVDFELWPTEVYLGDRYDLYFNGEPIELHFQGRAHTNGDTLIFFRKSDVISAGDIYQTQGYPFIDQSNFGHINGIVDGLNEIIRIAVPGEQQEGGTMIIPGHGRLSDEADIVDYRDMITIIRDRVQYLIDQGMDLDEVLEAQPSRDYDARYGNGFVSTESFITSVFNTLSE